MTTIKHHGLVVQRLDDDILLLTQRADHLAAPASIRMSAGQLRAICDQLGIVRDPQSRRTIAGLQRRMMGLHERIEALADWMARHSDHEHADLSYETTKLHALLDLATEWCEDFAEAETNTAPASAPAITPATAPAPPPGNDQPKAAAVADALDLFASTS